MGLNSFKRYEKKFLVTKEQYESLMPELLKYMRYDRYCLDGKIYHIHNVYYDTVDNEIIRNSTNKPPFKEKLRLRSYYENVSSNDLVYLEIKRKSMGVVTKRRVELTLDEADAFINEGIRPQREDYTSKQIINEIGYFLSLYKAIPMVYISYERIALFGKDNPDFRLTFDHHIITRRENVSLSSCVYGEDILGEDNYVMEIKIEGALPLWLAQLLSFHQIYPVSYSKYGEEYKREVKAV